VLNELIDSRQWFNSLVPWSPAFSSHVWMHQWS